MGVTLLIKELFSSELYLCMSDSTLTYIPQFLFVCDEMQAPGEKADCWLFFPVIYHSLPTDPRFASRCLKFSFRTCSVFSLPVSQCTICVLQIVAKLQPSNSLELKVSLVKYSEFTEFGKSRGGS